MELIEVFQKLQVLYCFTLIYDMKQLLTYSHKKHFNYFLNIFCSILLV